MQLQTMTFFKIVPDLKSPKPTTHPQNDTNYLVNLLTSKHPRAICQQSFNPRMLISIYITTFPDGSELPLYILIDQKAKKDEGKTMKYQFH